MAKLWSDNFWQHGSTWQFGQVLMHINTHIYTLPVYTAIGKKHILTMSCLCEIVLDSRDKTDLLERHASFLHSFWKNEKHKECLGPSGKSTSVDYPEHFLQGQALPLLTMKRLDSKVLAYYHHNWVQSICILQRLANIIQLDVACMSPLGDDDYVSNI